MYYGDLPIVLVAPIAVAVLSGSVAYLGYLSFVTLSARGAERLDAKIRRIEVDYHRLETILKQQDGHRYIDRHSVYRVFYDATWRGRKIKGNVVYADDPFWGRSPATRRLKRLIKRVVGEGVSHVSIYVRKGRKGVEMTLYRGAPARHWLFTVFVGTTAAVMLWSDYHEFLTFLSAMIGILSGIILPFKFLFGHDGRRREWKVLWCAENEARERSELAGGRSR